MSWCDESDLPSVTEIRKVDSKSDKSDQIFKNINIKLYLLQLKMGVRNYE
jgi:hypothetical protein